MWWRSSSSEVSVAVALAPRRGSSSTAIYCIEATPSSDRCGFEALWYKYYYHALHHTATRPTRSSASHGWQPRAVTTGATSHFFSQRCTSYFDECRRCLRRLCFAQHRDGRGCCAPSWSLGLYTTEYTDGHRSALLAQQLSLSNSPMRLCSPLFIFRLRICLPSAESRRRVRLSYAAAALERGSKPPHDP